MNRPNGQPTQEERPITPDMVPPLRDFAVVHLIDSNPNAGGDRQTTVFRASDFQIDDTGALVMIRREVVPNLEPELGGDWKMKNDFVRAFAEGQWKQIVNVQVDKISREEAGS